MPTLPPDIQGEFNDASFWFCDPRSLHSRRVQDYRALGETFTAPGDDLERFMYGCSILVCLPDGRSHEPSEATGTVMRPSVLERYARRAGFDHVEVLPIEDFSFFRFYRLHH